MSEWKTAEEELIASVQRLRERAEAAERALAETQKSLAGEFMRRTVAERKRDEARASDQTAGKRLHDAARRLVALKDKRRRTVKRLLAVRRERDTAIEQMRALGDQLQQAFDEVAELRRVLGLLFDNATLFNRNTDASWVALRDQVRAAIARPASEPLEPTHRCKDCHALWRLNPPSTVQPGGSWSLVSDRCGECCDNVEMGEQIEALARPAEQGRLPACEVCASTENLVANPDGPICKACAAEAAQAERDLQPAPGEGEAKLPHYCRAEAWPKKDGEG